MRHGIVWAPCLTCVCHARLTKHCRYGKPKCLPHLGCGDMFLLHHCPDCVREVILSVGDELGTGSVCHLQFRFLRGWRREEDLKPGVEGQPEQHSEAHLKEKKINNQKEPSNVLASLMRFLTNNWDYFPTHEHTENQALESLCIISRQSRSLAVGFSS